MATNLATVPKETRLAHPLEFTDEQTRLLAETVAKGCDQNELAFFLNVCKLKRLDPFTGQVHCVKRWDSTLGREKMSIQVGIDGFRVIAARSGELAGISEPEFDSEDDKCPQWAHVTVYRYGRDNEKIPYAAKARYSEYVQVKKDGTPNHMWATKPFIMLGKCAEALALRKAFPDELSGMYSDEEMGQADNEVPAAQGGKKPPVQQPSRASAKATQNQPAQQTQAAQQTQPAQQEQPAEKPGEKIISGIIEKASQAKSGTLWVTVKGEPLVVAVDGDKIDGDMVPGNFIKFRGLLKHNDKLITDGNSKGRFWALIALFELSKVQEGEVDSNAKLDPENAALAEEMFGDKKPEGNAVIEDMKAKGQVTTAANLPTATKPGCIGIKRGQRVWALINQNKANNNGFSEEEMRKIMSALPVPIEHIRDLEMGMYEQVEKWATGEDDWREFWKD